MKLKGGYGFSTKRAEANMANTPTSSCPDFATSPGLRTEGRFVNGNNNSTGRTAKPSGLLGWYHLLRVHYQWSIFQGPDMHSGSRGRSRPHGKILSLAAKRAENYYFPPIKTIKQRWLSRFNWRFCQALFRGFFARSSTRCEHKFSKDANAENFSFPHAQ